MHISTLSRDSGLISCTPNLLVRNTLILFFLPIGRQRILPAIGTELPRDFRLTPLAVPLCNTANIRAPTGTLREHPTGGRTKTWTPRSRAAPKIALTTCWASAFSEILA